MNKVLFHLSLPYSTNNPSLLLISGFITIRDPKNNFFPTLMRNNIKFILNIHSPHLREAAADLITRLLSLVLAWRTLKLFQEKGTKPKAIFCSSFKFEARC